jgi:hypothetical protein
MTLGSLSFCVGCCGNHSRADADHKSVDKKEELVAIIRMMTISEKIKRRKNRKDLFLLLGVIAAPRCESLRISFLIVTVKFALIIGRVLGPVSPIA